MIAELSGAFSVSMLCKMMGMQRSSYYYWKQQQALAADLCED